MLNRRAFLHAASAAGLCSLMPELTLAAANTDKRLVVIMLRGGMDALDVIQPWGDPAFKTLRPAGGKVAPAKAFAIDNFFGMHEALKPIHPLFNGRELGIIHGVSTPYRDRSHFEAQDFLERGSGDTSAADTGWVNRLIPLVGGKKVEFAADIGTGSSLLLQGPARRLNLFPESDLGFWADSGQFLELLYKDDAAFQPVLDTLRAEAGTDVNEGDVDRGVSTREISGLAARLLKQECRIAGFSLYGWDTHARQANRLAASLKSLADAITTLKAKLGRDWEKTLVIAASEFGRTARYNGTFGTDHGTGGAAFLAGGLLANGSGGKVLMEGWPGIGEDELYEGRDLKPTGDIRRPIGWALCNMYGLAPSDIEAKVFPGVDLGAKMRIV